MNELGFSQLDMVMGAFVVIFCILGFIRGALRQFFSILAFITASIVSAVVPCFIKMPVGEGGSPVWGCIILAVIIWIPAYLILNSIGSFIINRMLKGEVRLGDRFWGFCFGGIKGLLIIMIIVFLVDSFPVNLKQVFPSVNTALSESKVVSFVQPYNPFLKLHIMQNLRLLISSVNDPDYMELLVDDPAFQNLIQQKSIKMLLNDAELKEILNKQQYLKFITHPKVQGLIKDPEALKLLMTTDIDKAVIANI